MLVFAACLVCPCSAAPSPRASGSHAPFADCSGLLRDAAPKGAELPLGGIPLCPTLGLLVSSFSFRAVVAEDAKCPRSALLLFSGIAACQRERSCREAAWPPARSLPSGACELCVCSACRRRLIVVQRVTNNRRRARFRSGLRLWTKCPWARRLGLALGRMIAPQLSSPAFTASHPDEPRAAALVATTAIASTDAGTFERIDKVPRACESVLQPRSDPLIEPLKVGLDRKDRIARLGRSVLFDRGLHAQHTKRFFSNSSF
jgi:hypothetical protein